MIVNHLFIIFIIYLYLFFYCYSNLTSIILFNYYQLNCIKRLIFYERKYDKCNSSTNLLYCGSKYEGYKVEQKNYNPFNYFVTNLTKDISENKHSKYVKCDNKKIIIGITSAPTYYLQRISFRLSYNIYSKYVSYIFFTGMSHDLKENNILINEQRKYHDIVVFNFESSYFNSSLLMVLVIKWINKKCTKYNYFVYHTSDVFFNIQLFTKHYIKTSYNYIAKLFYKPKVVRSKRSRFYIPFKVYKNSVFPTYPSGPFIALSKNAIRAFSIFNFSKITNIWIDDVVLGLVFNQLNIIGKNINNIINNYPIYYYLPNIDHIKNKLIYIHSLPPGSIYFLQMKLYSIS